MTLRNGLFVRKDDTKGTTPNDARLALAGMFSSTGVLTGGAVTGTAGWSYSVGAFTVVSQREAADGVVLFSNDSAEEVATTAAPSTGARIDIVYALHRDVDNADADSAPILAVASGTASGSPVAPTLPQGAVEIARATVGAGATNTNHADVTIGTGGRQRARLRGTEYAMFAVKGIGDRSLANATYDWFGTSEPWSLIGPAAPPLQFAYVTSGGTTLGQGLQAQAPGLFRLSASLQFPSNSTGDRFLRILKNGTIVKKIGGPAITGGRHCLNIDATTYLQPGDRLGVQAFQSSGSSMTLYNGEDSRQIVMEYLGE